VPRNSRVKIKGEIAYYHIISRTVGQQFLLGKAEKEELVRIIRDYSRIYFVEVNAYCIMSNHFHLVIRVLPAWMFSDDEVVRRIKLSRQKDKKKKNENEEITPKMIQEARGKFEDISEFCKSFKQEFSCWYNKKHNRTGYFWGSRFKSLYLGNEVIVQCVCAYVELNPVRAGMVEKPEAYRWSSLHNRQFARSSHRFCSFDGIFPDAPENLPDTALLNDYRALVYHFGNIKRTTIQDLEEGKSVDDARALISDELYEKHASRHFKPPAGKLMLGRIRYFTDGVAIGSKDFIIQVYNQFAGTAILKKDRKIYPTGIGKDLYSINRLRPKPS
jgi:REP element-mobilizing transposase RayT